MLHRFTLFPISIYLQEKVAPKAKTNRVKIEKTEFALPSRIESIEEAVAKATSTAIESGVSEDAIFGIDLAVHEAVTNAVKHGNQFDETKQVQITFEKFPQNFVITIKDEGSGFDLASVPDPTNPENLLKESGRGILFMKNFMDEVSWERAPSGGTIVHLTKKF